MNIQATLPYLKKVVWDYEFTDEELLSIFEGKINVQGRYNQQWLFQKLLQYYNWYTLLSFIPVEWLPQLLTEEVVKEYSLNRYRKNTGMQEDFYLNTLYPLQNKVLHIVQSAEADFYLTGGTALSRCYLHHRYSDDLDFFINNSIDFTKQVERVFQALTSAGILFTRVSLHDTYSRIDITEGGVLLKVDFVNDVSYRHGNIVSNEIFNKIDSIENIFSNKLSALNRQEPKDMADILFICYRLSFSWQEAIAHAQQKDAWVNEMDVQRAIADYNVSLLERVKWIKPPDLSILEKDLDIIASDIFFKRNNSLLK